MHGNISRLGYLTDQKPSHQQSVTKYYRILNFCVSWIREACDFAAKMGRRRRKVAVLLHPRQVYRLSPRCKPYAEVELFSNV